MASFIFYRRILPVILFHFFLLLPNRGVNADGPTSNAIGIVESQTSLGPCVAMDGGKGGYMVPYIHELGATGISFEMIPVPGGRVSVGSPEKEAGHRGDEGPMFEVELAPFWIGKTEVTWREFQGFMRTDSVFRKQETKGIRKITDRNRTDAVTVPTPLYEEAHHKEYGNDPRHPAVTMTQYSAKQYTKWLSGITGVQYRLPTEAEWEYAARAGSSFAYCFGNEPSLVDQYAVHSTTRCALVASKKPNLFGLYDMHGNVWEWTIEQYSPNGFQKQGGQKYHELDGTQWVTRVNSQCVRGGSWSDPPNRVRSASRMGSDQSDWASDDPAIPMSPWWYTSDPSRMVGMRLVRSAKPLSQQLINKFWEIEIQELQDDVNECLEFGRGRAGLAVPELLNELDSYP